MTYNVQCVSTADNIETPLYKQTVMCIINKGRALLTAVY